MGNINTADDAHINTKATVPWWALAFSGRTHEGSHHEHHSSGTAKTGMVLSIIALALVLIWGLGWFGFSHGRDRDRHPWPGNGPDGPVEAAAFAYGTGWGGGFTRAGYYQDQCYKMGDTIAQINAERYADAVGMKTLDKAIEVSNRELGQYATWQDKLNCKDQLIAKMYTDGQFQKAECAISHCVKEIPNMVDTKQLVAPIGPIVKPLQFDMICNDRCEPRYERCEPRYGYGGGYGGQPYCPPNNPPYPWSGANYPGMGFPGQTPVIPPVITTPASIPVTVYPQPLVTSTAP
jgi:hypothetical protein